MATATAQKSGKNEAEQRPRKFPLMIIIPTVLS
jgi:hypothetical protein